MGAPEYDTLVARLAGGKTAAKAAPAAKAAKATETGHELLERKNIILNCEPVTPEEAIRRCGELMVKSGYVEEGYIQGMLDRDASFSVAIGCHVAIPHGTNEAKHLIKKTGMVVMTYPQGIDWNDDKVKLVVGIAAQGDEHLDILGRITDIASTDEDTDALVANANVEDLFKKLNGLA
jgi:mannitol/fructose-specific phosphotransferase system IIA component